MSIFLFNGSDPEALKAFKKLLLEVYAEVRSDLIKQFETDVNGPTVGTVEAAKFMEMAVSTFSKIRDNGDIPYRKKGNQYRFYLSDLNRIKAIKQTK